MYAGSGWRLASLDSLTKFGQATPPKVPVCYAAPEVVAAIRRPGGTAASYP